MSTDGPAFLIYSGQQVDIGVRVITFREPGAPNFADVRARTRTPNRGWYSGDSQFGFVEQANQQSRKATVNQVILHHDGTRDSLGCYRVLVERGLSTHLMVDGTGIVYQPLDLALTAWHAAGRNDQSVGLDLNNPVRPERMADPSARGVFKGRINGGEVASLGYTDAQYDSLIAVLRGLGTIFPSLQNLEAPVGEDGRVQRNKLQNAGFTGLVGHLHVSATKWDPGPGFDWERVLIGVRGTRLFYPVTLAKAPNLDAVPKARAMSNAETYFRNTEAGPGGYFPVGANQAWHTGVHLNVPVGTPVRAPADGVIVAARNTRNTPKMGSANVIVIRHELEVGGKAQKFFSVISHLQPEVLSPPDEIEIGWIRRLALDPDGPTGLPDEDVAALYPPAAPGMPALLDGRVALCDIEVKAGELIGTSGTFNPDPYGEQKPNEIVDFALIAANPLFPAADPTFEVIDDDLDDGILCNARKVWKRFTTEPEELRGLVSGGYPLAPEEVSAIYQDDRVAQSLRWVTARHVTEYSDRTDFSGLFGGGVDFEWSTRKEAERYVKQIRAFLWWDAKVSEWAKLPEDRLVWAYHPIALSTFLAVGEARRAVEQGGKITEALAGEALEAARRQDRAEEAADAASKGIAGSGDHVVNQRVDDIDAQQDLYEIEADALENEGWMRWEQGEWEREE
jgi:N-acetyl-anhydromuramyl-L-alanine amidase AmpD